MTSLVLKSRIAGHILIKDKLTNDILLETKNDIHPKNASKIIARGLSGSVGSQIHSIKLGNGGTSLNDVGVHIPRSPNILGTNSTLYNTTYTEVVANDSLAKGEGNSVIYQEDNKSFSVVIVTAEISVTEPLNQLNAPGFNPGANADNLFAFDEMGLFTADNIMLTHSVFPYPVLKTAEQELQIVYSLTIECELVPGD